MLTWHQKVKYAAPKSYENSKILYQVLHSKTKGGIERQPEGVIELQNLEIQNHRFMESLNAKLQNYINVS